MNKLHILFVFNNMDKAPDAHSFYYFTSTMYWEEIEPLTSCVEVKCLTTRLLQRWQYKHFNRKIYLFEFKNKKKSSKNINSQVRNLSTKHGYALLDSDNPQRPPLPRSLAA